jgi:CheY-like chemotaxis protein
VTTAGTALLALVNDVLDFSKLEAGQFEITPRPADPELFAREALLMFSPQAEAKGLALDFAADGDIPPWLSFDTDRVRQILINLIGNAIKFTVHGGITLRARYDAGKQHLHLEIQDTGPGLSRADQAKLFQRFAQVDGASTRKHGGTGLGLAICKGLTEAMGGQIGLRSKRGQGSTFHLYIAAPSTAAPEIGDESTADAPMLEGVRILVVDDNPMNRELARTVLELVGADVSEGVDGEDGLRCAAGGQFDVILLDYRMPGIDGPETLRRLRGGRGPNARTPVLAFTADSELASFQARHDFDGVIAKPINAVSLISTVAEWIGEARPEPQTVADAV